MLRDWWRSRSSTFRFILKTSPILFLGAGVAEAVVIRTKWLSKPLMEEPVPGDAKGSVESTKEEKLMQKKRTDGRLGESLNKIFERAAGDDNSLLAKVKGKGRELLEDFKELSKREKGQVLEEIGKQVKERREKMIEEVKRKADDIDRATSILRENQKRQVTQGNGPITKIRRLLDLNREANEGDKIVIMEEIGEALGGTIGSDKEKSGDKKIKLLFIGDSLSACVGVTDPTDGLVLQKTTAKLIQEATGRDVEWYNTAVVGGTVKEIRDKMDGAKTRFLQKVTADEELVVVIICGLNDYKSFVLSLWNPWLAAKMGPLAFKAELLALLRDVRKSIATPKSRIFIPAIPIHLMASDPKFLLSVFPLSFMGWSLNAVWDTQKFNIAFEEQAEDKLYSRSGNAPLAAQTEKNTYYIGEPPETASDQVENNDVVASDGVHLNTNGYSIWAKFIAANILQRGGR